MRFPSQLLLTGAVVGAFTASTGTALILTASAQAPEFGPAIADAHVQASSAAVPEPLVDGSQIAELAAKPARERAADVAEEHRREQPRPAPQAVPPQAVPPAVESGRSGSPGGGLSESDWERLPPSVRKMTREACDAGYVTGPRCENA